MLQPTASANPEQAQPIGLGKRLRTQSLFLEAPASTIDEPPLFTLKDYDHRGLKSMYLLYMKYSDPTEYQFAMGVLGSWKHWERLCKCKWFQKYITRWRHELALKIEAEAIQAARVLAKQGVGPQSLQAAKWLHSVIKPNKRGRPSKEEVTAEVNRQAKVDADIKEDLERIL